MYKQEVTLDDGTTGEVSAKTQSKWKVGDEVVVTRNQTQYGTRFSFSKPEYSGAQTSNYTASNQAREAFDNSKQHRIDACWAIAQVYSKREINLNDSRSLEQLKVDAITLIHLRNSVVDRLEKYGLPKTNTALPEPVMNTTNTAVVDSDLPF
jgi:hypothetical protein